MWTTFLRSRKYYKFPIVSEKNVILNLKKLFIGGFFFTSKFLKNIVFYEIITVFEKLKTVKMFSSLLNERKKIYLKTTNKTIVEM